MKQYLGFILEIYALNEFLSSNIELPWMGAVPPIPRRGIERCTSERVALESYASEHEVFEYNLNGL